MTLNEFCPQTIIEPFRVRSVEPIRFATRLGLQLDGTERPAANEPVRLAFPRRVYTQSHVDYLTEVIPAVHAPRERLPGYRIVQQAPVLRRFTARPEPIEK